MMNSGASKVEVLNPSDVEVAVDSQKSFRVKSRKTKKLEVRKMAIIGVLAAISIMLSMTPLGFIPIGPLNLTIMHIPVIIGAIIEGPLVGATVGLVFGLFSIYQNITAPTLLSPVFMNPIIAIVPRVLIGIVAYYVYIFIKNKF